MQRRRAGVRAILYFAALVSLPLQGAGTVAIVEGTGAPELERFASGELRAYLEKLFGIRAQAATSAPAAAEALFLIGSAETNQLVKQAKVARPFPRLSDQGILLRRATVGGTPALIVGGGSPRATLWAVYELVQRWGAHYLADRDIIPGRKPFLLPEVDAVMEPLFRVRAHPTVQDFAASGESWGIADFRPLMDQLAKLKFTRMNIYAYGWQPYLDWQYGGIQRRSATLWYNYHYHITPDMIGRQLFGNATEFWNPDLPLSADYRQSAMAGEKLIRNIITYAHSRGLECTIAAPTTDFPPEFAPLLKGAEQSHQLGGLTVVPGRETALDDPQLFGLASAALRATVEKYAQADMVMVGMPEFRQWVGEYQRAWQSLDAKYGIHKVLSLEDILDEAARRRGSTLGAKRAADEVKGDIASLYFYDRLIRSGDLPKLARPNLRFMYWGPSEELFPVLDRILPPDWEIGTMPSNHPSEVLKRLDVLKHLPAKIAGVMDVTLDDDNIGVMPQLTTNSLHRILQEMKSNGWAGFVARERFPGDHDWPLAYLARAAWDSKVTPDQVAREQLDALCGELCGEELLTAFHEVEAVTIALAPTAFAFPADWPPPSTKGIGGMLLKYWRAGPMAASVKDAREGYQRALDAALRARSASTREGSSLADYWVGRLNFAVGYVEAVQHVHQAAVEEAHKDLPGCRREADAAVSALAAALEAYSHVVRNQTDRGAIAVVNEHCYRPLKLRRWYLNAWGL
jgi:hypothetical protein